MCDFGLITRRSRVQIPPPLLPKALVREFSGQGLIGIGLLPSNLCPIFVFEEGVSVHVMRLLALVEIWVAVWIPPHRSLGTGIIFLSRRPSDYLGNQVCCLSLHRRENMLIDGHGETRRRVPKAFGDHLHKDDQTETIRYLTIRRTTAAATWPSAPSQPVMGAR